MNISEKLKYLRSVKKLTQKELAKNLGTATSVIGDIEIGRRVPSKNIAMKLAKYFNTTIESWIDDREIEKYLLERGKFSATEEVIKTLKEKGHIKNGVPSQAGWELIKEGLMVDLKFMDLEKKE